MWAFWEFRGPLSLLILGLWGFGGFTMGEKGGSSAWEERYERVRVGARGAIRRRVNSLSIDYGGVLL